MVKTPHFTAGGAGLTPDWGTKIPHAMRCDQKKKKRVHSAVFKGDKYSGEK